ncbi:MAG: ATP-binding protein [Lentilitoribacter sp.]
MQFLKTGLFSILWVLILTFGLHLLNIGKISPIPNTTFIETGALCVQADCLDQNNVELPYFATPRPQNILLSDRLNFEFDHDVKKHDEFAFLFPKIQDDIALMLNGELLRQDDIPQRHWNHPHLVIVPPSLLLNGKNQLSVTLYGPAQEGLDLQPFYFGPANLLESSYTTRWLTLIGVGMFSLGLMGVLFLTLGFVWLGRRQDRAYLWLSLSCASACIFLFHYSTDTSFMNYKFWTATWGMSVSLYVLFIMKFLNRFMGFDALPLERVFVGFLILSVFAMVLAPASHVYFLLLVVNYGTEFFALCVLITFWINRKRVNILDFAIFYTCLSISAALGLYGLILLSLDEPLRNHQLFHFTPLVMAALCLWLIMSQLMRNLRGYEQLNLSLQEKVDQKTAELTLSYERLAKAQRAEAVNDERQRIMSDLHDGIGGQLVNTLAYMQNNDKGDEIMRNALEDALRDLSLMLDSLETDDSIVTLLGMLRTRLEALLEKHGLQFDWQIEDEPVLKKPSPSNNLHLTRIVQEAITNVIKHANASVITISTDASSVLIKDNGNGFKFNNEQKSGHGISGMKRRARQIGAHITFESDDNGTMIRLDLA